MSCGTEPTDDWTVEHVFQWSLLQSYKATDEQYESISQALHQQLCAGEEEVWQVHQEVLRQANAEEDCADGEQAPLSQLESEQPEPHSSPMQPPLGESENKPPAVNSNNNSKASYAAQKSSKSKTAASAHTIRVEIVGGMYEGKVFDLQPKPRGPCMVGRSGGKKFKDKGISLTKDLEVSTTHGKFEIINGNLYFTDTGSTNGTKVEGEELEPDTPFPLTNNLEILCGQTLLKITLP
jgi:FKBP-type peptidyl-prolyl cis-trans isomerase